MQRRWVVGGLGLSCAVLASAALPNLARTFIDGLSDDVLDNDAQWRHVSRHEERFVQALRAGTAAEGDDAGV